MDYLALSALVVAGFVGCAEFGSVLLVHPVIRTLDLREQLVMERGLLRTFGRVMPVGMTLAPILAGIYASQTDNAWAIAAAATLTVALVVTIVGNVPINIRTGRIDSDDPPPGFEAMRRRWDVFQLVRGTLQFVGFVLMACAVAL